MVFAATRRYADAVFTGISSAALPARTDVDVVLKRVRSGRGLLGRLLIATDGFGNGDLAVAYAVALGRSGRSDFVLGYAVDHAKAVAECSVSNGGGELLMPLVADLDEAAASLLAEAAKTVTDAGLIATTTILDGPAGEAIVACAEARDVDAVVMGTQGIGGLERALLGSTVSAVLRGSSVPVFVVPHAAGGAPQAPARILVAVDDSDPSDSAVAFAIALAAEFDAQIVFCTVAQIRDVPGEATPPTENLSSMARASRERSAAFLEAPTERARERGLASESVVAEGDPADEILSNAASANADLIVVGTHGRRGFHRLFVGSVAESIVRRSAVPVAVVRTAKSSIGS